MTRPTLILILLILSSMQLPAQKCDGEIRFVIFDSLSSGASSQPIRFDAPSSPVSRAGRIESRDGAYQVVRRALEDRDSVAGFWMLKGTEFVRYDYGCGGSYEIMILRRIREAREERFDTMTVTFVNVCDARFGADIRFQPGKYYFTVCDAGRVDQKSNTVLRNRSLSEQYPEQRYGGYDITSALRSAMRRLMPAEFSTSFRLIIVDSDGNPIAGTSISADSGGSGRPAVREIDPGVVDLTLPGTVPVRVIIAATGFMSDTVTLAKQGNDGSGADPVRVQLARPGDAFEYRRGRKFAYTPRPDIVALLVRSDDMSVSRVLDSLGVTSVGGNHTPFFIGRTQRQMGRMNNPVLAAIRRSAGGASAGVVRSWSKHRVVVFSDRIHVECRSGFDPRKSELVQRNPYIVSVNAGSGASEYILTVAPEVGEGIVDVARELMMIDGVVSTWIEYIQPPGTLH